MTKINDDEVEFTLDESHWTKLAQAEAESFAKRFRNQSEAEPSFALDAKTEGLRPPVRPHNDLSGLTVEQAEEVTKEWVRSCERQAKRYAESRNSGATPRAYDENDPEQVAIVQQVEKWLERRRLRGHGKRK